MTSSFIKGGCFENESSKFPKSEDKQRFRKFHFGFTFIILNESINVTVMDSRLRGNDIVFLLSFLCLLNFRCVFCIRVLSTAPMDCSGLIFSSSGRLISFKVLILFIPDPSPPRYLRRGCVIVRGVRFLFSFDSFSVCDMLVYS